MDLSQAHLHLMLNHIPVIGSGMVLLFMLAGLLRKSRDLTVTAMLLGALVAVSAPIVKETGEGAEDQVKKSEWFHDSLLEEHEGRADKATVVLVLAGVIGLAGAFLSRGGRTVNPVVPYAFTAFLTLATLLMAWTALAGGEIRHDEIRPGKVIPAEAPGRPRLAGRDPRREHRPRPCAPPTREDRRGVSFQPDR